MFLDLVLFRSARLFSSTIKKKSLPNDNDDDLCLSHSSNHLCPICRSPYDNQKHKRLIDTTCQHEKCYTCMFKYEQCSICLSHLGEYMRTIFANKIVILSQAELNVENAIIDQMFIELFF